MRHARPPSLESVVRNCKVSDMMPILKLQSISRLPVAALLGTALWADQVTLTNGDDLTGAVVKKDGAKLR